MASSTQRRMLARTPLHNWHATHGARFAEEAGWELPAAYTDPDVELAAARKGVGIVDVSGFAKLSLHGPGVPELCRSLSGGALATAGSVATLDAGGPSLACRLADEHLVLLASTADGAPLKRRVAEQSRGATVIERDATAVYAGFVLLGPHTDVLLRHVTAFEFPPNTTATGACAETVLAGVHAMVIREPTSRTRSTRVYVACDLAEHVWEQLLAAGDRCGIMPIGLDAWRASGKPTDGA